MRSSDGVIGARVATTLRDDGVSIVLISCKNEKCEFSNRTHINNKKSCGYDILIEREMITNTAIIITGSTSWLELRASDKSVHNFLPP